MTPYILILQLTIPSVPYEVEAMFEHGAEHLLYVWVILGSFAVGLIVMGNLVLHRIAKDSR